MLINFGKLFLCFLSPSFKGSLIGCDSRLIRIFKLFIFSPSTFWTLSVFCFFFLVTLLLERITDSSSHPILICSLLLSCRYLKFIISTSPTTRVTLRLHLNCKLIQHSKNFSSSLASHQKCLYRDNTQGEINKMDKAPESMNDKRISEILILKHH